MGRGKVQLFLFLSIIAHTSISVQEDPAVKQSLQNFYAKLSNGITPADPGFISWLNSSKTYCSWSGVECTARSSVRRVALDGLRFNGSFDVKSVCYIQSLVSVSIKNNSVGGSIPDEFYECKQITHLYLNDNRLAGPLPASLSDLSNMKRIDISNNNFSGPLPDGIEKISGLIMFLAQNNDLSGRIPQFDFNNLRQFNVSYNNFSGPLPDNMGRIGNSSFIGNKFLCGKPLEKACPLQKLQELEEEQPSKFNHRSITKIFIMYLGYILLVLVILSLILYHCITRRQRAAANNREASDQNKEDGNKKESSENNASISKQDYNSIVVTSNESQSMASPSMVVVTTSQVKGLMFDDLLRAQAELLGRGRSGNVYKVMLDDGSTYTVKRIKGWQISSEEFKSRMEKVIQSKHNNVLSPLAFYCAHQEKLVVYEYQPFGSLLNLLQGSTENIGQPFDWGSRLNIASTIAETLAYMHKQLQEEGIAHGNLNSSNIMMYSTMDACISEYGLMQVDDEASYSISRGSTTNNPFKSDVFNYGVILLELLTGKPVHGSGVDLAGWVQSVVREEWTVEVFDKVLIGKGADEERMMALLQAALDCVKPSQEARPSMSQVAAKINAIKEEDDMSIMSEGRFEEIPSKEC